MYVPLNVEPFDCETCGPSYDELNVEFNDDGFWEARLSLGCYGGESFVGDRQMLVEWLARECAGVVSPADLASTIDKINAA